MLLSQISFFLSFCLNVFYLEKLSIPPPFSLHLSKFTMLFMPGWFYSAAEESDCVCVFTRVHFECVIECEYCLCMGSWTWMCVCVCRPFFILLGSLICFGSVWWAGHEANYLLKGKSQANEPHWATEVTGLIKHSVCITGYLTQDPTVYSIHWAA